MPVTRDVAIPLREIELLASRSSGPGGQHANVTASRIEARFDVAASSALSDAQKARVTARCGPVVRAIAQDARSQARNRELALERLRERLARALAVRRPAPRDAAEPRRARGPPARQAHALAAQARPAQAVRGRLTGDQRPAGWRIWKPLLSRMSFCQRERFGTAAAGVEAQAGDRHVHVAGVRVDRDPLALAGLSPAEVVVRGERALQQAGAAQRVGDRARAVVARVLPATVAAAPLVGQLRDLVAGGDDLLDRLGGVLRRDGLAVGGRASPCRPARAAGRAGRRARGRRRRRAGRSRRRRSAARRCHRRRPGRRRRRCGARSKRRTAAAVSAVYSPFGRGAPLTPARRR